MEVHVYGHRIEVTEKQRAKIESRVLAALRRFGHRVKRVTAYLSDENGTRGGVDKRVRLIARLRPSGQVMVREIDASLDRTVYRAARRLAHAVKRELRRRHTYPVRRVRRTLAVTTR